VATLYPVLPDLGPAFVTELQREFRYFLRKRPNTHLDTKVRREGGREGKGVLPSRLIVCTSLV